MKIYLAGPMRGKPLCNFPAFDDAAKRLRDIGFTVFNPAERDRVEDGFDPATSQPRPFVEYMRIDLPQVMACDVLALLPGWENSKGAQLERHVARECGIPTLTTQTLEDLYHGIHHS
jgi:hypothetical protein